MKFETLDVWKRSAKLAGEVINILLVVIIMDLKTKLLGPVCRIQAM